MKHRLAFLVSSSALLFGCELWDTPMSDPDCSATPVAVEAELLLSQPWLRLNPRAKNAAEGAFSFAGQLSALHQRYPGLDAQPLWQLIGVDAATPAAELPFRLLAIVNRTDLAEQLAPESPAGEARLVYTLTDGPGDDLGSPALPLTLIFEYSLGSAHSARDWASAFHGLGALSNDSRPLLSQATHDLVVSFISPPLATGSPSISQVRVNDARAGVAVLNELAIDGSGKLQQRGLRNTPRAELAGTPQLISFARDHQSAIEAGNHRVPAEWLTTSARVEPIAWLGPHPRLDHDFSRGTCPGCHGADGPGQDGFHLRETAAGDVALSPFLTEEDLPRRAQLMRTRLCGQ